MVGEMIREGVPADVETRTPAGRASFGVTALASRIIVCGEPRLACG